MAGKRLYVWYELPSLRDYSNGIMVVIASSKDQAIKLAADNFTGRMSKSTTPAQLERRSKFLAELMAAEPEIITTGAVHQMGGA